MKAKVEITSYLRDLIGSKEIVIEVETSHITVKELLSLFTNQHGEEIKKRIFAEDGAVLRNVFVFLNNNLIHSSQLDETLVHDGDSISVLPAVGGG